MAQTNDSIYDDVYEDEEVISGAYVDDTGTLVFIGDIARVDGRKLIIE